MIEFKKQNQGRINKSLQVSLKVKPFNEIKNLILNVRIDKQT